MDLISQHYPKSSEGEGYRYLAIAVLLRSIIDQDQAYIDSRQFRNLAITCNVPVKLLRSLTRKQAHAAYDTFITSMNSERI